MHLQLGFSPVLVISSSDLAKQCFITNDKAFASCLSVSAANVIGYVFKIVSFSPYSSYWRNIRKLCMLQLLTTNRIESFRQVRTEEVSILIHSLFESSQQGMNPINIKSRLSDLTLNLIVQMAANKRFLPDLCLNEFKEVQLSKEMIEETFLLGGLVDIGYYLPFLKWLDLNEIVFAIKNLRKKREIPFGSGRIICSSMSLGLIVVTYSLGRLLQSFEWFAREGTKIDMTEGLGVTMLKLIPLESIRKPRLPLHLY
ncbi:hypothetical protein SUGI_0355790 [Cryptomeria japonica]|nr:hypothetical protein SUGI_0355790 [Cryptomeria japonica]